jgi:hypothetical protein
MLSFICFILPSRTMGKSKRWRAFAHLYECRYALNILRFNDAANLAQCCRSIFANGLRILEIADLFT